LTLVAVSDILKIDFPDERELSATMNIAVQIDFDGTITEEDVSFLLLDTYVGSAWREHLEEYTSGRIPVGAFNKRVFGMMKADRQTMTDIVLTSPRVKVRPGFRELIEYCVEKGFKIVIVSNGLRFYIEAILESLGVRNVNGLEIYAARNDFYPGGVKVAYIGPDGTELEAGFKEAYTGMLVKQGYRVIYLGNGDSDIYPSRLAKHVFATDQLLKRCRAENLDCFPFNDFFEVIKGIETLDL
jgi:2-hydroxy-3-keto-5-methylthiopentenyl-1-phosphate phosphatase